MNDTRQPRWERRKDSRPAELIQAALELFVERGFATTRLEDVAARAGVSKGTLYLYFESKEDLFKAVVRSNIIPVIAQAEQLIDRDTGSSAELLRRLVRGWWESVGNSPASGLPKLVMSEAGNFPELARWHYEEAIARADRALERVIQRGIEQGEFRPVDVEYTRRVMLAPIIMLSMWRHSFGACDPQPVDPERYIETYLDLIIAGLQPRPPE